MAGETPRRLPPLPAIPNTAVRFFSMGGYQARQTPRRLRTPSKVDTQDATMLSVGQVDKAAFASLRAT